MNSLRTTLPPWQTIADSLLQPGAQARFTKLVNEYDATCSFVHPILQDYLAAQAIVRQLKRGPFQSMPLA